MIHAVDRELDHRDVQRVELVAVLVAIEVRRLAVRADDDVARQKARRPVGEWNALEIVSNAGALKVSLNGTPISHSQAGTLNEGLIGIQAEDHRFEVRRMRIRTD